MASTPGPVIAKAIVSEVVRDASGKVVRKINLKRGDVVHDPDDIALLAGHSKKLTQTSHHPALCPEDCAVANPPAEVAATPVVAPAPAVAPAPVAPKVFPPHTFVPVGEVNP